MSENWIAAQPCLSFTETKPETVVGEVSVQCMLCSALCFTEVAMSCAGRSRVLQTYAHTLG